ncbi:MAG: hypothetical protein HGB26_01440 [Desulfobulbaceae bacterium]|nr:hypothetical protein [Desulfobulbaceae bacterium]
MPTYTVTWTVQTNCWATVDAESPEEAIEKAKKGEHNNDTDSEPGATNMRSFRCEGIGRKQPDSTSLWNRKV